MNKSKRVQVTTTLDATILEEVRKQSEPLSKFLDRAIANELSRSANAASRLAEAFQECIKAAIEDAIASQGSNEVESESNSI